MADRVFQSVSLCHKLRPPTNPILFHRSPRLIADAVQGVRRWRLVKVDRNVLQGFCESQSRLLEVSQPPHQGFFFLWVFVSSTTCPCTILVLQTFDMRSSSKCQCRGQDNSHTSRITIWFLLPWPFGFEVWQTGYVPRVKTCADTRRWNVDELSRRGQDQCARSGRWWKWRVFTLKGNRTRGVSSVARSFLGDRPITQLHCLLVH